MITKESPNLDLLRTCAIGLVVLSHVLLFVTDGKSSSLYNFHTMGRIGVAIFFVHTTLVLMMSLERQGAGAGPFMIRRLLRIYPLSVAIVALMTLFSLVEGRPIDLGKVLSNLLLIQNLTGAASTPHTLWTLPYEVQMYLLLPVLYTVTRSARPLQWTALILAGTVVAASISGIQLVQYVSCFLPGMLAFVLGRRTSATLSPWLLFLVVGTAILVIPALVAAGLPETPLFWVMCLLLGLIIPLCRQLASKPLARAGNVVATYSYSIYLTHLLAFGYAFGGLIPGPWFVQWGVFLAMLAGLPCLTYRYIEKPGIDLGIKLAQRIRHARHSPNVAGAN